MNLFVYLYYSFTLSLGTSISTMFLNAATSRINIDSYDDFLMRHPRASITTSDAEFHLRKRLFEERKSAVVVQNSRAAAMWTATLNSFSDWTEAEKRVLLGYKGHRHVSSTHAIGISPIFMSATSSVYSPVLPKSVDWRNRLRSGNFSRQQGSCGSCWAMAAIGALEAHLELAVGSATWLSGKQLVDCVPNPQHCGGSGGCAGATTELAFEYVKTHGVGAAGDYLNQCSSTPAHARIRGFVPLPRNRVEPLLHAVAHEGPVAVAVDASNWFQYHSGIFNHCAQDAIVNHAVILLGYGQDAIGLSWLIRNSWGLDWGERGCMRVLRHKHDGAHCGTDRAPEEGFGCEGGPKEVQVCGMCGILSDSTYPVGVMLSPLA